jgi:alkylation response protein AidB-like acyl-CoA dehydrogenase
MNFDLPMELTAYLNKLDQFIDDEIKPLERENDNMRFFDHRREWARTDFDRDGLPRHDWEALLKVVRSRADRAGFLRFSLASKFGGQNGSNLWMSVIREHLAAKGLGLHNDLQNEHSIVGNFPTVVLLDQFGTLDQQRLLIEGIITGDLTLAFGLTEAGHGSDATHLETTATAVMRDGQPGWMINGNKMWTTGLHTASHVLVFARTEGTAGDARGITALIVPARAEGIKIEEWLWTFNMPTDHPRISITNVWVPETSVLGRAAHGLSVALSFVHENRIRQAASSLGAATFCIDESVKFSRQRAPFGTPLATNQAIQWPLVELATQAEMLRLLIRKTASQMDTMPQKEVAENLSDKVSMCNFWANRMVCEAADRAMQIHGGIGYSRHKPFEHIYRHHRRYRITEGSEEIQMRKIASFLFGFVGPKKQLFAQPPGA